MIVHNRGRYPLPGPRTTIEQRLHEPDHIRLDLIVRAALQKLRNPTWADAIVV